MYWKTRFESKEKELEVLRLMAASTIRKPGNSSKEALPAEDPPYLAGPQNRTYEFVSFLNASFFLLPMHCQIASDLLSEEPINVSVKSTYLSITADRPPIVRSISICFYASTVL